ncbi:MULTISPECIES: hypothetical protein [Cupriavidus]|uniref:Succinate dehydrogenase hydrophobic anchor subunit n=1 Tax=Cupriavidus alkaliphilus TaxID=942866 RepID=A0A7W4VGW2_9BURK|nr:MULTISPECIES: hypothetical protein [Cupriavidus]MBB3011359.1 succinate dehydrogenase hydrophobic anchor subunit [Cupriavidus alkaliphilus]
MEQRLFALQRLSAMVMAPFVLVHLGVILYAVRGGLTAAEILSRTQGSLLWIPFYSLFVISVAVHRRTEQVCHSGIQLEPASNIEIRPVN